MNKWRWNSMLLKKLTNKEIKEDIRRYLKKNNNENTALQNPWVVALRGKFVDTGLPQETRKISYKQPKLAS